MPGEENAQVAGGTQCGEGSPPGHGIRKDVGRHDSDIDAVAAEMRLDVAPRQVREQEGAG